MENNLSFANPFRPGAGHIPPYLAGRQGQQNEIKKLLDQKIILENAIITGLRGVGKTVLLESLKPLAHEKKWLWVGNDLSESVSISEENLAMRIIADISIATSFLVIKKTKYIQIGFNTKEEIYEQRLGYSIIKQYFDNVPGLISDKLKATLEFVWSIISKEDDISGIVFAYDEAQNLTDHAQRDEYPLSLLLDVFQSIQRKEVPFILFLSGLPNLFQKLVDARTFAERMFHIMTLDQLGHDDSRDAIIVPLEILDDGMKFSEQTVEKIINLSGGYPYFIQFICKELFDAWGIKSFVGEASSIAEEGIISKLDTDFFFARWEKATDRQKDILIIISQLENCDKEFTVQDILSKSANMEMQFSHSRISQILSSLIEVGLVYKNKHARYSLAVPLFSKFLQRQFVGELELL